MKIHTTYTPSLSDVKAAAKLIDGIAVYTPLAQSINYSKLYDSNILLKREDLQLVRSYKIRGAYNKMKSLSPSQLFKGVVCASAGNHAQGVAYSCNALKVKGKIFMPTPTPGQKIEQVKMFGDEYVEVILIGDTFDEASQVAQTYCKENEMSFIHPFDDEKVIEGQATIGLEILKQFDKNVDYIFLPVGGGGLAAGLSSVFKVMSPNTKLIGVEPKGAPSMSNALKQNKNCSLECIDKFVDGAAVKQVGDRNFEICRANLDSMLTVDEGKICETILYVYNKAAIVLEPAGALAISALEQYKDEIKGKNVICIVSGGNNDITRMEEIKERAMLYKGLKHYFLVKFPQRAGALKEFVADILGPSDDITYFEYTKKTSREKGTAVVGIELKARQDFNPLMTRMKDKEFFGGYLNENKVLLDMLV